jgi:ferredoxin-NADP reductase
MSSAADAPAAKVHEFTADLVVRKRTPVADEVIELELADPQGQDLPSWEPGAHVDLMLSDGLVRQYSLCGDPREHSHWRVGVLLDPESRGGSRHVHDKCPEGTTLRVRGPRNHFRLVDAPRYLFIAGGIGITPILPMLVSAERDGSEWNLVYLGRSRKTMAFADDLEDRFGERVTVWPRDERGRIDFAELLSDSREDTLVYCCGPERLLSAVEEHSKGWPPGSLHTERFAAKAPTATETDDTLESFDVICQRSGVTLHIGPDISVLEALEGADVPVMGACYEGICGTCEATVIEGEPDHRDSILSEEERSTGNVMMTCVSRSRSEKLVLDL